jgi:hypothetical protein
VNASVLPMCGCAGGKEERRCARDQKAGHHAGGL